MPSGVGNHSGLALVNDFAPYVCQFCAWSGSAAAFSSEYDPYAANMTELISEGYYLCIGGTPYVCSDGYEGTSNDLTPWAHAHDITSILTINQGGSTTADIQSFLDTSADWAPFIAKAVAWAQEYGYGGWDIDWEPDPDVTVQGGYEYAHFLDEFGNATSAAGLLLSIDLTPRWDNDMWNLPVLGQVPHVIFRDMDYSATLAEFDSDVATMQANFPLGQIGLSLDPEKGTCSGGPHTCNSVMVQQIAAVHAAGVRYMGWWSLDQQNAALENTYEWSAVHDYLYAGAYNGTTSQNYSAGTWGFDVNEHPTSAGGTLSIATLGVNQTGNASGTVAASAPISSVVLHVAANFNAGDYSLVEQNLSSNGLVLSTWRMPDANASYALGLPQGGPAYGVALELSSAPGGVLGGYQNGAPGTFVVVNVSFGSSVRPPVYQVAFFVSPTACSDVSFNGTVQRNLTQAQFLSGVYTLHAPPCSGYSFSQATLRGSRGGDQVVSTSWSNITVSTNATLWVNYTATAPPPVLHFILTFYVEPSTCGPISFNGTAQANGTSGQFVAYGFYPASAPECPEHSFVEFSLLNRSGGRDSWVNSSQDSVDVGVTSNDESLTAIYSAHPPPPLVAFANATQVSLIVPYSCGDTSPPLVEDSFSGNAAGGAAPYTFLWTFAAGPSNVYVPESTATGRNVTQGFYSGPASYFVSLNVSDTRGDHAWSNTTVVLVQQTGTCPASSPAFSVLGLGEWESLALLGAIAVAGLVIVAAIVARRRGGSSPPEDALPAYPHGELPEATTWGPPH